MNYRRFWIVAAVVLVADLLSKYYVFAWVNGDFPPVQPNGPFVPPKMIIAGWLEFALHYNLGAVWGIGQGKTAILIALTSAIIPAVVMMAYSCRTARAPLWALGLLLGGAAGNLYDRVFEPGVRDFLHVLIRYNDRTWPIFNVADAAIVVGVFVYAGWSLFFAPAEEDASDVSKTKTDADAVAAPSTPTKDTP